jgi:hypothetical protein
LSNGYVLKQTRMYQTKSGQDDTTLMNAIMRTQEHVQVMKDLGYPEYDDVKAQGDDCIAEVPHSWGDSEIQMYVEASKRYGTISKGTEIHRDEYNFCSHRRVMRPKPSVKFLNEDKAAMQLLTVTDPNLVRINYTELLGKEVIDKLPMFGHAGLHDKIN